MIFIPCLGILSVATKLITKYLCIIENQEDVDVPDDSAHMAGHDWGYPIPYH